MNGRIQQLRDKLVRAHHETWATLCDLSASDLATTVYAGEGERWSARDLIAHLVDAEKGLALQAERLLQGENALPEDFDIDRWNQLAVRRRAGRSYELLLEDLAEAHQSVLELLGTCQRDDLKRRGSRPDMGELTLEELLRWIGTHRRRHTMDLANALQSEAK